MTIDEKTLDNFEKHRTGSFRHEDAKELISLARDGLVYRRFFTDEQQADAQHTVALAEWAVKAKEALELISNGGVPNGVAANVVERHLAMATGATRALAAYPEDAK